MSDSIYSEGMDELLIVDLSVFIDIKCIKDSSSFLINMKESVTCLLTKIPILEMNFSNSSLERVPEPSRSNSLIGKKNISYAHVFNNSIEVIHSFGMELSLDFVFNDIELVLPIHLRAL
jgi:hypothetical protein